MKPLKSFSVFLVLLLLLTSCMKDKLTKATQTGANTFSCKVNGKVYVAQTGLFSPGITGGLSGTVGYYQFYVSAVIYNNGKNDYLIDIAVPPNFSIGKNNINLPTTYVTHRTGNDIVYLSKSGEVDFTNIDYSQRIISGTFSFTAVNANTNDVINVTDGRFDLKN